MWQHLGAIIPFPEVSPQRRMTPIWRDTERRGGEVTLWSSSAWFQVISEDQVHSCHFHNLINSSFTQVEVLFLQKNKSRVIHSSL